MFDKLTFFIDKTTQRSSRLYLMLFFCAFLIRLAYVATLENKWYFYDTVHYDKAAQSLLAGEGFGSGYRFSSMEAFQNEYSLPPVYPVFLAGIYAVFGRDFFVVRMIQCGIGALMCLMIYLIGKEVFDRRAGFLAALVSLVYPLFIFISGLLYVTELFTLLILLFVWFALKGLRGDNTGLSIALAGLFLGLATLAGPILFALYPMVALWLLIVNKPAISKFKLIGIVFGLAILTLMPWSIRNYRVFGRIAPVSASVDWFLADAQSRVENELTVRVRSDSAGNHFEVYVKGKYSDCLTDASKAHKMKATRYAGILSRGGYSNNIERFVAQKKNTNGDSKSKSAEEIVDDFDRMNVGDDWAIPADFKLVDGELSNRSMNRERDFLAVFKGIANPAAITIEWDEDTEASGVSQTGIALMLDRISQTANGYVVKRQPYGLLELWLLEEGRLVKLLAKKMPDDRYAEHSNGTGQAAAGSSNGVVSKVFHIITDDFQGFLKHYVSEFIHFWKLYPDRVTTKNQFTNWKTIVVSIASFAPILALGIIGFVFSFSKWEKASLLFFVIMSFALGYSFFQTRVRYRIPIEPYLIIFAAHGFLVSLKKLEAILCRQKSKTLSEA